MNCIHVSIKSAQCWVITGLSCAPCTCSVTSTLTSFIWGLQIQDSKSFEFAKCLPVWFFVWQLSLHCFRTVCESNMSLPKVFTTICPSSLSSASWTVCSAACHLKSLSVSYLQIPNGVDLETRIVKTFAVVSAYSPQMTAVLVFLLILLWSKHEFCTQF